MKKTMVIGLAAFYMAMAALCIIAYSSHCTKELKNIPSNYHYAIDLNSEFYGDSLMVLTTMANSADRLGLDIVKQINYYDTKMKKPVVKEYILSNNKYSKFSNIIKGQSMLLQESNNNSYISNLDTKNKNQMGQIYDFGGSVAYYAYPFITLCNQYDIAGIYYVSAQDIEEIHSYQSLLISTLNSGNTNEYIYSESDFAIMQTKDIAGSNTESIIDDVIQIATIAFFCIITLLILFSCVFITKEVSVLKTNGISNWKIAKKIIKPLNITTLVCIALYVAFCLVIDKFNSELLIYTMGKMILAAVIVLSLAFLIYCIYICMVRTIAGIKGKAPIKTLCAVSLVSYLVLTVICVGVYNVVFVNTLDINTRLENIIKWESIQNYGTYYPVLSGLDQEKIRGGEYPLDIPAYNLFKHMNANENALFASSSSAFTEENSAASITQRIFIVNSNYLNMFPIKDIYGNDINISQNENQTIYLIPQKYMTQEDHILEILSEYRKTFHDDLHVGLYKQEPMPETLGIKIIYMADDQMCFSMNLDVEPNNYNMIKSAIIQVLTDGNCLIPDVNIFSKRPSLYIPLNNFSIDERQKEFSGLLNKLSLSDNLPYFVQTNDLIMRDIAELKLQTTALASAGIILTLIIILIIAQSIIILFRINEKECFLLKTFGKNKWHATKSVLKPLILVQCVAITICLLFFGNKVLIILFLTQMLYLAIVFIILQIYEKKNILNVLKKGI